MQAPLCSGGSEIVFAGYRLSGRPTEAGREVRERNGVHFFLTGACEWVCTADLGVTRTAILTEAAAQEQLAPFMLGELESRSGEYPLSVCDAGPQVVSFRGSTVRLLPSCGGNLEGPPWLPELRSAFADAFTSCPAVASPVTGSIWYTLVVHEEYPLPPHSVFEDARPWPLSTPAATTAVVWSEQYDPLTARRQVSGDDARALRALRDLYLSGELTNDGSTELFIPISDSAGTYYRLWVSDVVPYEGEDGLLPFTRP